MRETERLRGEFIGTVNATLPATPFGRTSVPELVVEADSTTGLRERNEIDCPQFDTERSLFDPPRQLASAFIARRALVLRAQNFGLFST